MSASSCTKARVPGETNVSEFLALPYSHPEYFFKCCRPSSSSPCGVGASAREFKNIHFKAPCASPRGHNVLSKVVVSSCLNAIQSSVLSPSASERASSLGNAVSPRRGEVNAFSLHSEQLPVGDDSPPSLRRTHETEKREGKQLPWVLCADSPKRTKVTSQVESSSEKITKADHVPQTHQWKRAEKGEAYTAALEEWVQGTGKKLTRPSRETKTSSEKSEALLNPSISLQKRREEILERRKKVWETYRFPVPSSYPHEHIHLVDSEITKKIPSKAKSAALPHREALPIITSENTNACEEKKSIEESSSHQPRVAVETKVPQMCHRGVSPISPSDTTARVHEYPSSPPPKRNSVNCHVKKTWVNRSTSPVGFQDEFTADLREEKTKAEQRIRSLRSPRVLSRSSLFDEKEGLVTGLRSVSMEPFASNRSFSLQGRQCAAPQWSSALKMTKESLHCTSFLTADELIERSLRNLRRAQTRQARPCPSRGSFLFHGPSCYDLCGVVHSKSRCTSAERIWQPSPTLKEKRDISLFSSMGSCSLGGYTERDRYGLSPSPRMTM